MQGKFWLIDEQDRAGIDSGTAPAVGAWDSDHVPVDVDPNAANPQIPGYGDVPGLDEFKK